MSMRLLQALADASLPMEIKDVRVKEQLRALRDAGHIICSFPPRGSSDSEPACVHMVTALGRKVLLRYFGRKVVLGAKKPNWAHQAADKFLNYPDLRRG